jgi:hypothetical protein
VSTPAHERKRRRDVCSNLADPAGETDPSEDDGLQSGNRPVLLDWEGPGPLVTGVPLSGLDGDLPPEVDAPLPY